MARAIFRALGKEPSIEYVDMPESLRAAYQYFTQAELARLRGAGFDRPMTALEDGVADYVTRYLAQSDRYR
jgi:ADP-L-glycero-D-manno-heptose 6-epimerase